MQIKENIIITHILIVVAIFILINPLVLALNLGAKDSSQGNHSLNISSGIDNSNRNLSDTINRAPIKLLSSPGDTPLFMRNEQYRYLFSLIKSEQENLKTAVSVPNLSPQNLPDNATISQDSSHNPNDSAKNNPVEEDTTKVLLSGSEGDNNNFTKGSLLTSIAKKDVDNNIYWLITFYGIWLLLKLFFPIYHHKIFLFTERAIFKLSNKNTAILSNFQLENIFFRGFSLMVYTYLIIIYLQYYPSIAFLINNDYWIFLKIFILFLCFYLIRFMLISFWHNKFLQRSQIFLHSIYSTGFAMYFLIIATIFTFLNPESAWYEVFHDIIFYVFLYFLFSKAILILREYLRNNHRVEFSILSYLILFEFSIPIALLYFSFLG